MLICYCEVRSLFEPSAISMFGCIAPIHSFYVGSELPEEFCLAPTRDKFHSPPASSVRLVGAIHLHGDTGFHPTQLRVAMVAATGPATLAHGLLALSSSDPLSHQHVIVFMGSSLVLLRMKNHILTWSAHP